jgi:hypothetical protein
MEVQTITGSSMTYIDAHSEKHVILCTNCLKKFTGHIVFVKDISHNWALRDNCEFCNCGGTLYVRYL